MNTVSFILQTTDEAWIARNAQPGGEPGTAIVTIPAVDVERFTFAGHDHIAFDLGKIDRRLPVGWMGDRHASVPVAHVVAGTVPGGSATGRTAEEARSRRALELFAGGMDMPAAEAQARKEMP